MLFQSAVVAGAEQYLFGFGTSGRVGHSNVEPVVFHLVLGNRNLGSGYLGFLTVAGNFVFYKQMSNLNSLDEIIFQSKACREVTFRKTQLWELGGKFWSRSHAC